MGINLSMEMARFELDPLWSRLTDDERQTASAWGEVYRRMRISADKGAELALCRRDFLGVLDSMSQGTVYRRMSAISERGLEGALSSSSVRRAAGAKAAEATLPAVFVSWWRGLCGMHQRRKCLSVWRHLMREWLLSGKTIPGYGLDWRGIWLREHEGCMLPSRCPYTDIHAGPSACAPRGWGYSTLLKLAPDLDAWAGAAVGVHSMQAYNPSVPHTRVGLRPMQVITMDDVTLDAFCWYPGEREPRRPVGLGTLDVLTGSLVSWCLVPVRKRADGTSAKLDGLVRRYADATLFCSLGIDALEGLTMLLEHGTAGMDTDEEARLNKILGVRPDGGPWLTVLRSSTSGAPIMRGMFRERGRGRPTHKAMIESAWNLLHNESAMLPGPSGKDWDNAPQDTEGWTAEDRALIKAGAELLARGCPEAVEALARARTHALPYSELDAAVRRIISEMNHRRDHGLEGWEACGFVRSMVDVGGALVELDAAARSLSGGDEAQEQAMRLALAPRQQPMRMSPAEAMASFGGRGFKRWDAFTATRILGAELAQDVRVTERREFVAKDAFSGEAMAFGAVCRDERNMNVFLTPGKDYSAWVNPFNPGHAMVGETDGRFIGLAPFLKPTTHGSRDEKANLATLAVFRGEQRRRMEAAVSGKASREGERKAENARGLAEASGLGNSGIDVAEAMADSYVETGDQV